MRQHRSYPKRAEQHIAESSSRTLLSNHLPREWVTREVTERDYGVDLYVEIVGKDKVLAGNLTALQLKAVKQAKIRRGVLRVSGVKRATLNYWLSLPVPVFLVVACMASRQVYWANVREQDRRGRFDQDSKTVSIELNSADDFSEAGVAAFNLAYVRERRWPDIEDAIEKSLMLFNTFGPLVLMCKRGRDNAPCTTTIQYLINQHYEHYTVLSRYLLGQKPKYLRHWYAQNIEYMQAARLERSVTMCYRTLKAMLKEFASAYRNSILAAYELVTDKQASYFSRALPYLYMHLTARPHTFIVDDWFARFYFDEYENETQHPEQLYFDDFKEFDRELDTITRT